MPILPHIAGLDWQPDGDIFTATATREFWDRYYNPARAVLLAIGITIKKADVWQVQFNPAVVAPDFMIDISTQLREQAFAAELSESDRRAAAERWQREQQAIRDARSAEREEMRAAGQIEAQALGRACLDKWGLFAVQKGKMRMWTDAPVLLQWEIGALKNAVADTDRKAERRKREAGDVHGGVDWTDDLVNAAIRYLTGHDEDHAAYRNDVGWSSADSSNGHWCNAMMDVERPLALALGRVLVGKYERQLKSLIDSFDRDAAA